MDQLQAFTALNEVTSNFLNGVQRDALGIPQVSGMWLGRPALWSSNGTDVIIGTTKGLALGTKTVLPTAGTATVLPAKAQTTVAVSGLSANTWYYVYAYDTGAGASISYEYSTTAPDAYLWHKTGDTTRVYVGCFRTDGAGTPKVLPFRAEKGEYVWRESAYSSAFNYLLNPAGSATAYADLFVAFNGVALLPPHARLVRMRTFFYNASGGVNTSFVRTKGDTALSHSSGLPADGTVNDAFAIETDSSGYLEYKITSATGSSTLEAWTLGFLEPVP